MLSSVIAMYWFCATAGGTTTSRAVHVCGLCNKTTLCMYVFVEFMAIHLHACVLSAQTRHVTQSATANKNKCTKDPEAGASCKNIRTQVKFNSYLNIVSCHTASFSCLPSLICEKNTINLSLTTGIMFINNELT